MTKSESINSSGVSPIPTRIPVVVGIFSCPEFSRVFTLIFGFLLGAISWGIPAINNLSLDDSSISPILTLVSLSSKISFFVRFPAFVCGSNPVFRRIVSLISAIYSMVDEYPRDFSHVLASPYFNSGFSPVMNNASVHLNFLPTSAIARTCEGVIRDAACSFGSFL